MHPFKKSKAQEPQGTNSHRGTRFFHYNRITSFPVPLIFGLASASAFTSCHVCTSYSWGTQCKITLFEPTVYLPNANES